MRQIFIESASYGGPPVVQDVLLRVPAGDLLLLVGGNAAGKSTCLRAAVGLVPLVKGHIRVDGPERELSGGRSVLREVSYLPQGSVVFPSLTVGENLRTGDFDLGKAEWTERFGSLAEFAPSVRGLWGRMGHELSGGQRQIVGTLMVLLRRPRLVLLDEPFSGLDAGACIQLLALLNSVREAWKMSFIVAEHRLDLFSGSVMPLVGLRAGRVVFVGDSSDLQDGSVVEGIFGIK